MIRDFLDFELFHLGDYELKVNALLTSLIIFLFTKFLLWLIKKALFARQKFANLDQGNLFALFQIIRYVIWIFAITLILETVGVKVTVLIAGSAALLVGLGLGLQQTFHDIISGLILLFEGTTKVGDVLEIDNDVVIIENIGLRTSTVLNRDDIVIIIPNSLITTNKVINWSHQSMKTRFSVNVKVAYDSDINLVIQTLKECALAHPNITDKELIEVRLVDFARIGLEFQILFFSKNVFRIEREKSEIRKIIHQKFVENKVEFPSPPKDLD